MLRFCQTFSKKHCVFVYRSGLQFWLEGRCVLLGGRINSEREGNTRKPHTKEMETNHAHKTQTHRHTLSRHASMRHASNPTPPKWLRNAGHVSALAQHRRDEVACATNTRADDLVGPRSVVCESGQNLVRMKSGGSARGCTTNKHCARAPLINISYMV